jgi:predicted RNA-binding protein YlxR (DUF448 family)
MRTCIACGEKFDKRNLMRIVRTSDAGVVIDPTGKRNGRGAYLCSQPACRQRAIERRLLDRALQTTLTEAECAAILAATANPAAP